MSHAARAELTVGALGPSDGRPLLSRRAVTFLAWAIAALSLGMVGVTATLVVINRGVIHSLLDMSLLELVVPVGYALFGALVVSRRRDIPIGWIFLAVGLTTALAGPAHQYALRDLTNGPGSMWGSHVLGWAQNWISTLVFPSGVLLFFILLFPDGTLPSRRWRVLALLAVLMTAFGLTVSLLDPTPVVIQPGLPAIANPIAVRAFGRVTRRVFETTFYLGGLFLLVAAVVAVALRFRRARGEDRRQLKAFVLSAAVVVAVLFVGIVAYTSGVALSDAFWILPISLGFGVLVPVACGIAILKHGLYEIDLVISKTVLYGLLAAFVTAVYAAVVIGIGAAIGTKSNLLLSIVATAIVAISFQPVSERARHLANRLVFGKRASPYEVMSEFADRMATAYSMDDVLPQMAAILAAGTGAKGSRVWLRFDSQLRPAATWPADGSAERGGQDASPLALVGDQVPDIPGSGATVPIRHQGELLGAITVDMPPNEPMSPGKEKLVRNLASQAGPVLRNVILIEELKASRQRLVAAQDEERRRIERDLHDGAQQQLVALAVKANLARSMIGRDEATTGELLDEIKSEAQSALGNLRDLARGIYPPLLADRGLAAALAAQARKSPIPVDVENDGIGRYPQDVEAAVYFCSLEALQNVAKYAGASRGRVRLFADARGLGFGISDDGVGFDSATTPHGSGLQNMADRVSVLGGTIAVRSQPGEGTTVNGWIPMPN